MVVGNVPDDWGCYFVKCVQCGRTYHLSEGGCDCQEEEEEEEDGAWEREDIYEDYEDYEDYK